MQFTSFSLTIICLATLAGCQSATESTPPGKINWEARSMSPPASRMVRGTTYLSVYPRIYSRTEARTHDLTATVSIRNVNPADTVYLTRADYYNTQGRAVRSYTQKPVFIAPMETLEIIIGEVDNEGGTGANFLFEWATDSSVHEPFFEAVMISTSGQQGISFTTSGIRIQ